MIILVAPRPNPQPHIHRALRKTLARIRLGILQRAHLGPVDKPLNALPRPPRRVVMKPLLRAPDRMPEGPCRSLRRVSLAVVVCHPMRRVCPRELPVHLV